MNGKWSANSFLLGSSSLANKQVSWGMYLRELKIQRKIPGSASHLWNTKCSSILSSSILVFVNSTLCQIVKSGNPHCYLPILPSSLFLFAKFTLAKLWSLHCPQVHFSCLPTFTFAKLQGLNCPILKSALSSVHSQVVDCSLLFCYFVKLPCPLHLLDCPNGLQVAQVWYPSSTWAMAKWACKLPKSDFLIQLGQGGQWTSIIIALQCDV
jgi:hypothetical protein